MTARSKGACPVVAVVGLLVVLGASGCTGGGPDSPDRPSVPSGDTGTTDVVPKDSAKKTVEPPSSQWGEMVWGEGRWDAAK